MKKLVIAAAACTLAAPAAFLSAQNASIPGQVDPSRVAAGTYQLDPAHTLVSWQVNHFGFNDYFGLFGDIEGRMTLDPANISATELDITVPIASVSVASEGLRDHLLRPGKDGAAPDFFGANPEPARFVSTSVRRTGDTSAIVSGQLTMNGKTGPVTMLVDFTGAGENPMSKVPTVGFQARATIDRTQWGVDYAAPMVGSEVDLEISAAFERQQ